MSTKKPLAVVVLDGKVLYPDGIPENDEVLQSILRNAISQVPELLADNYRVLLFHTNSPEIENLPSFDAVVDLPMEIWDCNGEGAVGCLLQGFLLTELNRRGLGCPVISLIPEVEIDPEDQALIHPDHPFGESYSAGDVEILRRRKGWQFRQTEDGSFRRLIAGPVPAAIGDLDIIRILLENDAVVIAGAGNRVPRYCQVQGQNRQEEVFIDGNHLGALLSASLKADTLLLATGQGSPAIIEPDKTEKTPYSGPEAEILEKFLHTWKTVTHPADAQNFLSDRNGIVQTEPSVRVMENVCLTQNNERLI